MHTAWSCPFLPTFLVILNVSLPCLCLLRLMVALDASLVLLHVLPNLMYVLYVVSLLGLCVVLETVINASLFLQPVFLLLFVLGLFNFHCLLGHLLPVLWPGLQI